MDITMILQIVLFLLLFMLMFFLTKQLIDERLIARRFKKMIKETQKKSDIRELERERDRQIQGNTTDDTFLSRLDTLLNHSGIKKIIPVLNTNLLLIITVFIFITSLAITLYVTSSILRALIISSLIIVIMFLALLIMNIINFARTEKEIITFINLLQNYSRVTSDITNILGQMYPYLNEPLRSITEDCYLECIKTGNIQKSLDNLTKRINHKKLSSIIKNIAICAKYEANYETVINESRNIIQDYLSGKKQRKEMLRNAAIEIGIITGAGVALMGLLNNYMEVEIFKVLFSTLIGNALLLYFAIIAVATVWIFFRENYKDDN